MKYNSKEALLKIESRISELKDALEIMESIKILIETGKNCEEELKSSDLIMEAIKINDDLRHKQ